MESKAQFPRTSGIGVRKSIGGFDFRTTESTERTEKASSRGSEKPTKVVPPTPKRKDMETVNEGAETKGLSKAVKGNRVLRNGPGKCRIFSRFPIT